MTHTTYAVVDIETTGTKPGQDRIIQFGCVLVENGEIVSRFATDINPEREIPKQIENLTGISTKRARKAPLFDDVALTIQNLLEDTVFVAHNTHFDFNFLNAAFQQAGYPPLTCPRVDTVELSQIFFPTEPSYRLSDLSENFQLQHQNPHQADSDAAVTAELLIMIMDKIATLPLLTLEQIVRIGSNALTMETTDFIQAQLAERQQDVGPLPAEWHVVGNLVLRKKDYTYFAEEQQELTYPRSKRAKQKLYGDYLHYRTEQARMMNAVYDHFTKGPKNLFLEAATGMGKTIGYLLPLAYLATPEKPAVVATTSLLLQEQLVAKDIPLLNQILPRPLQPLVMKSPSHYLHLARFAATLKQAVSKQSGLYQMRVLVWLTETETGDLDELNLTTLQHEFWQKVGHRGNQDLPEDSLYAEEDFWRYLNWRKRQANVWILNHAFLVHEEQRPSKMLPELDYLVIDEAHHLPDTALKASGTYFQNASYERFMRYLEDRQLFVGNELLPQKELTLYQQILMELNEQFRDFFHFLSRRLKGQEQLLTKELFDQLTQEEEEVCLRIEALFQDTQQLQADFRRVLGETGAKTQQLIVHEWFDLFDYMTDLAQLFLRLLNDWSPRYVKWVDLESNPYQGRLHTSDLEAPLLPTTHWYQTTKQVLFTGGTLKIGNNKHYLPEQLGLTEVVFKTLANPFDYSEQARLMVPSGAEDAKEQVHAATVIETLKQLQTLERPILVLFTSHELLNQVYQGIHMPFLINGREVLAQGKGGSREKLLKRFSHSDNAILMGADSFWEGVDVPGNTLQLVVVTKLPFEHPQRPLVKARNQLLTANGKNPFYKDSLPKAGLRLRQALGRLIRSETDRGVLLVLDRRIVTASYAGQLLRALPKELPLVEGPLEELTEWTRDFLLEEKTQEK